MSIISEDVLGTARSQSPDDFSSPCSPESSRNTTPTSSPPPSYSGSVDGTTIKTESDKAEAKPVKKRKSWGQQLPTPTTNLPPRKRAKTAEEKEQRRVERVLRNRAAAQKSREVKKQQLEAIEQERDVLKRENEVLAAENSQYLSIVAQMQDRYQRMLEENRRLRLSSGSPEQQLMDDKPLDGFVFDPNYALDPTSLFSATGTAQNEPESPCMTHQPAALMCDLPCLQGRPTMTSSLISLMGCILLVATSIVSRMTVASRLRRNPLRLSHLSNSSTSSSTASGALPWHTTSLICCTVLAHLRIATDCSTQRAASSAWKAAPRASSDARVVSTSRVGSSNWSRRRLLDATNPVRSNEARREWTGVRSRLFR